MDFAGYGGGGEEEDDVFVWFGGVGIGGVWFVGRAVEECLGCWWSCGGLGGHCRVESRRWLDHECYYNLSLIGK